MSFPEPKRLLEGESISDELRSELQRLHDQKPSATQWTKLAAGLSAAGVTVATSAAQAATGQAVVGQAASGAKAVPLAVKALLIAAVPVSIGVTVLMLNGSDEATRVQSSAAAQAASATTAAAPTTIEPTAGARTPGSPASSKSGREADLKSPPTAAVDPVANANNPVAAENSDMAASPQDRPASPLASGSSTASQLTPSQANPSRAAPSQVGVGSSSSPRVTSGKQQAAPSLDTAPRSEVELLQTASTVLGASPAEALALCEEHRSRFPGGGMTQEREMIAITALVRLGRQPEAVARAERFRRNYPNSAYLRQIDKVAPPH